MLLRGYEPREKPDERFYDVMRELSLSATHQSACGESKHPRICGRTAAQKEAERWHKFQADVERTFLRPDKSDMKWQ